MKCPNCTVSLSTTIRNNVEIDYCPECRGVWLDRGEIAKINERPSQSDVFSDINANNSGKDSFLGSLFDF